MMERILLLVLVTILSGYTTTAISMCTTHLSTTGASFVLYRNNDDDITCYCVAKLAWNSSPGTINFIEQINSTGCQYQLQFTLHNDTKVYRCDRRDDISFYLKKQDQIKIQLIPGRDTTGGFIFRFDIYASNRTETTGYLTCYNPPKPATIRQETTSRADITTKIPQTSITTKIPQTSITTKIPQAATITTSIPVLPQPTSTATNNPIIPKPTSIATTGSPVIPNSITTNNTVIPQTTTNNPTDNNMLIITIMVCSVAGFVFITTMMFIICCLVKKKAMKNTISPAST